MKVILTTDVLKVGNKYDLKEFKDGYANVLIARGVALLATPKALADLASKKASMTKKKENELQAFDSLVSSINNTKIEIKAKANEKGNLFKAVNAHDVAKAIMDITGIEVDATSIVMDHIKELGIHSVEIRKGSKKGRCEVVVITQ